jgi:hypothetical protein
VILFCFSIGFRGCSDGVILLCFSNHQNSSKTNRKTNQYHTIRTVLKPIEKQNNITPSEHPPKPIEKQNNITPSDQF